MEKEICTLIEQALGLEADSVSLQDGPHNLGAWDSLGLLTILSTLEKQYGSKISTIGDLTGVQSVQEIVTILAREGISS